MSSQIDLLKEGDMILLVKDSESSAYNGCYFEVISNRNGLGLKELISGDRWYVSSRDDFVALSPKEKEMVKGLHGL